MHQRDDRIEKTLSVRETIGAPVYSLVHLVKVKAILFQSNLYLATCFMNKIIVCYQVFDLRWRVVDMNLDT